MELPHLYLDIETIPAGVPDTVEYPKKPDLGDVKVGNRKGATAAAYAEEKLPDLIRKWEDDKVAMDLKNSEVFRKRALESLNCEVICIGYALGDADPEFLAGTEVEIIASFNALLNRYGEQKVSIPLIGHNIMEFDLPILYHRAMKYQYASLVKYFRSITDWQGKAMIYDTMIKWDPFSYKKRYSIDNIAKFLGIPGKGDIDGSMVYDLYAQGKRNEIYRYCMDDIELLRRVYKRMITL